MLSGPPMPTAPQPQQTSPQIEHESGTLFPLKIEQKQPGTYTVTLLTSDSRPTTDAHSVISSTFDWALNIRVSEMNQLDNVRLAMRSGKADKATRAELADMGRKLYGFLFVGKIGEEFERRRKNAERLYIQLSLPPDLDDVPWEYLCEPGGPGEPRFLLLDSKLSLSRGNSSTTPPATLPELPRPLRLLIVVSSPPDLPEHQKLDTLRELRLIRQAVAPLVANGELQLHELDEPSPDNIIDEMKWQPHMVHFTGHGAYDEAQGGMLLIEDGSDHSQRASADHFEAMMGGAIPRLVVLSACQSGQASAEDNRSAMPSVGSRLVVAGVPAVVAMQDSVRDDHASEWAGRFYASLVRGWSVAQAMADARLHLQMEKSSDWGLPILLTEQPTQAILRFVKDSRPAPPPPQGLDSILLNNPGGLFVGRQLEQRRLARGLLGEQMRVGVIVGPGGIGKSSLAYRLYERTHSHFWAALSIDCSTQPGVEQILLDINEWLRQNGDEYLAALMQNDRLTLEQKLAYLAPALERMGRPYLLVLDNFESVLQELPDRSFAPQDALTGKLLSALSKALGRTKLLITCRYRFKFDHSPINVAWEELYDLSLAETVSLMGQQTRLGKQGSYGDYQELWLVGVRNPRLIEFVEAALQDYPLGYVKADLASLQGKLLENQLLEWLYDKLGEDARAMLRRAAVYQRVVPLQFLEMQMPDYPAQGLPARLSALLDRSLLNKLDQDGNSLYRLHESTRQWAEQKLAAEEGEDGKQEAQRRGAEAHKDWTKNSHTLDDVLEARRLYFAASDYDRASEVVNATVELLRPLGYYDLARSLLQETVRSLNESSKELGTTLHQLGRIEHDQGNYLEARRLYNESLQIATQLSDLHGVANSLHQLGILEYHQGNNPEALRLYNESLQIARQLGNLIGVASGLHQLGKIEHDQGNYSEARRLYNESLQIEKQLDNLSGVASSLGQLGNLERDLGNYSEARRLYNESLQIATQLSDLISMWPNLHGLGTLEQVQGNYLEARRLYNESLQIATQLSDLIGVGNNLYQLSALESQQGNNPEALRLYNESLQIARQLGNLIGVASGLHQLGKIEHDQGNYSEARRLYNESLQIYRQLSDLGGIALSLGNLGILEQDQGNNRDALRYFVNAYSVFDQLGSPQKETAANLIVEIRERVGEEQFNTLLEELDKQEETDE